MEFMSSSLKSNLGGFILYSLFFILDFNVCEKIDVEPGKNHKFIINKLSSLLFPEWVLKSKYRIYKLTYQR